MKERQLFLQEIINETQKWLKNHSQKQTLCVKQRKDKVLYYAAQGMQTATFCGQQGRISRTVRAILNGQPGRSAGQRVLRPTDQY